MCIRDRCGGGLREARFRSPVRRERVRMAVGGLLEVDDRLGRGPGAEELGTQGGPDVVPGEFRAVLLDRRAVGPGDQVPERLPHLGRRVAEFVGAVAPGGPLRPPGERRLGALRPDLDHAAPHPCGVDRAVQYETVGPRGEHLRVDGPQVGAVGVAQVGDLPLPQDGADDVHVAGGVAGGEVREPVAVPGTALVGDGAGPLDVPAERRRLVGVFDVLIRTRETAGERGAAAHAARVEPDQVVLLTDLLGQRGLHHDRHLQALVARTTGVEEDRAVPFAGDAGLHTGDRQLDRPGVGVAVVQRHPDGGALERRGLRRVASVPGRPLVLESLQRLRRGCLCRRREGGEQRCRDPRGEQRRHASYPHDGRSFRSTSRSERPFRVGGAHESISRADLLQLPAYLERDARRRTGTA